ncbi:MAG: hypothetical protein ACLP8X_44505 [Streptosporangiaceae bacterium]
MTVVFRETALRTLAHIRSEDKDVFARTRRAIASLADQPYPDGAVAWGLAFPDLVTEVEGGSAVRCPGQFPDIVTSLHLL